MARVGVYLGTSADPTENVIPELSYYGEILSKWEVEAFGSASLPSEAERYYNHINVSPRTSINSLTKIKQTYQDCSEYIESRDPDCLFQIWTYGQHAPGLAVAGWRYNIPVITRLTEDGFNQYKATRGIDRIGMYTLNRLLGRLPIFFSDKIIAFGPYGKSELTKYGYNEEDIVLLPPPGNVGSEFIPPENKLDMKAKLNIPENKSVALYVGRMTDEKGLNYLLNVISRVQKRRSDVLFLLIGKGPFEKTFKQHFSSSEVRVEGYVDHSDIHKYYKSADVYIHPSAYEGIPLTILEALNCEVPILARPAGDIPLVTDSIVQSPAEMANAICTKSWDATWRNKRLFEEPHQRETLNKTIDSVT